MEQEKTLSKNLVKNAVRSTSVPAAPPIFKCLSLPGFRNILAHKRAKKEECKFWQEGKTRHSAKALQSGQLCFKGSVSQDFLIDSKLLYVQ